MSFVKKTRRTMVGGGWGTTTEEVPQPPTKIVFKGKNGVVSGSFAKKRNTRTGSVAVAWGIGTLKKKKEKGEEKRL